MEEKEGGENSSSQENKIYSSDNKGKGNTNLKSKFVPSSSFQVLSFVITTENILVFPT